MAAWMRQWVWVVVVGIALPGCSTCSWFGRNSDCSNNCWGKKPDPVRQGPLAGTYTQPNNANMTVGPVNGQPMNGQPMNGQAMNGQPMLQGQSNGFSQQSPVITTTPAGSAPGMGNMPASPLNTPPAQFPTNGGTPPTSMQQLPPAEFNPNPAAKAMLSNSMVTANGPVVPQPEVKGPPILDLNVPGTSTAKKADTGNPSPFPLVMAPPANDRSVRVVDTTIAAPNISPPPAITVPAIKEPEVKAPAGPPPLPTPPTPPSLN